MSSAFPFPQVEGQKDVRKGRFTLGNMHGWFYIHLLVSAQSVDAQRIFNQYKEQFDVTNNVQPDWYLSHFNNNELRSISSEKCIEIFEHRKNKGQRFAVASSKYSVKACRNWSPNDSKAKVQHIGYGNYVVEGVSPSALEKDDDVLSFETYQGMRFF